MAKPLLDCPKHWLKSSLSPNESETRRVIAKAVTGSTPKTLQSEYWGGPHLWLTPREVTQRKSGLWFSQTERTLSAEGVRSSSLTLHPPNTVFLSKRAPVGAVAMNAAPMATNQGFIALYTTALLRPLFLAHWLVANGAYLKKVANGSTYAELYIGDLYEFEICVPGIEEQNAIVRTLSALQFGLGVVEPLEEACTSSEELIQLEADSRELKKIILDIRLLLLQGTLKPTDIALNMDNSSKVKSSGNNAFM